MGILRCPIYMVALKGRSEQNSRETYCNRDEYQTFLARYAKKVDCRDVNWSPWDFSPLALP